MLIHALPYYKMRINEALSVYDTIMAEASDRAKTAAKVVLQLGDPVEARRFLMRTVGHDKVHVSCVCLSWRPWSYMHPHMHPLPATVHTGIRSLTKHTTAHGISLNDRPQLLLLFTVNWNRWQ